MTLLSVCPAHVHVAQMVDAARENEATLRETIEQLRQEISSMSALVEQGSGVAASHVRIVEKARLGGVCL